MRIILMLAALTLSEPALAAEAGNCGAAPATPPAHFSDWEGPSAVTSAVSTDGLAQAAFSAGEAVVLALHPDGEVTYQTLPKGEGEAASFGGMASFTVAEAGQYAVGLGSSAWIDVVKDGKPQATVSFGHGPECTGIRKVVAFHLVPGTYTLEISGNEAPEIRVLVGKSG